MDEITWNVHGQRREQRAEPWSPPELGSQGEKAEPARRLRQEGGDCHGEHVRKAFPGGEMVQPNQCQERPRHADTEAATGLQRRGQWWSPLGHVGEWLVGLSGGVLAAAGGDERQ